MTRPSPRLSPIVAGIFATLLGLLQMFDAIQKIGDISPAIICGGLKVTLIPILYSLLVYFLSLILRIIQKPRI